MWERNGRGVSIECLPLPSKFSSTVIWVSDVLRSMRAIRLAILEVLNFPKAVLAAQLDNTARAVAKGGGVSQYLQASCLNIRTERFHDLFHLYLHFAFP